MKSIKLTYEELESKVKYLENQLAKTNNPDETQTGLLEKYRVIVDNASDLIATTTFGLKTPSRVQASTPFATVSTW